MDMNFVAEAHGYRKRLLEATDPGRFRDLWRVTNLPYAMSAGDPYSSQYRDEVLNLFRNLTAQDYSTGLEMTSTKQGDADFQLGYPWMSRDPGIIATELAKTVQAFQALQPVAAPGPVIEFGAGWGNLSLPLAQAGYDVTTVDLDAGFNARLRRLAAERGVRLHIFDGAFMQAAEQVSGQFEAVVFQSSFHHCLDFDALLTAITGQLLTESGNLFFLSEPIYGGLNFPWGLRYDGEALWAIMCNGWLELGFNEDFFFDLMLRHGLLPTRVPGLDGLVGGGWRARRATQGIRFAELALPTRLDSGFHPASGDVAWGRFCRARSRLPGLGRPSCTLTLRNFCPNPLKMRLRSGARQSCVAMQAYEVRDVTVALHADDLHIESETWVPDIVIGNSDRRELGVALTNVRWI